MSQGFVGPNSGITLPVTIAQGGTQTTTGIPLPNIIIGGNFTTNPWQRGTTFTAITNSSFSADRFKYIASNDSVVDMLKTTDAPTASEAGVYSAHCLNMDVTTADSTIGDNQYSTIEYIVEGLDASILGFGQSGAKDITLSFWHKHTKTGIFSVTFRNSANDRCYVAEYTQTTTNTWEKATITITGDTTGTWLYTNGIGLRLYFGIACGSTFTTAPDTWTAGTYIASSNQVNGIDDAANFCKFALVKLEMGSIATPYPVENQADVLAKCQRYYESTYPAGNYATDTSIAGAVMTALSGSTGNAYWNPFRYMTAKRATPTVLVYSFTLGTVANVTQDNGSDVASTIDQIGDRGCRVKWTNTASRYGGLYHLTISAEL